MKSQEIINEIEKIFDICVLKIKENPSCSIKGKTAGKVAKKLSKIRPMDKTTRRLSNKAEENVAKAVGGSHPGDSKPFDVIAVRKDGKLIGIEVKRFRADNKTGQIHMEAPQLKRKRKWLKQNKAVSVTVLQDDTTGKIYWKKGLGSFRRGSMTEVKGGYDNLADVIGVRKGFSTKM